MRPAPHGGRIKEMMRWLPAVVWMSVIFYLSHQTGDDLSSFLPLFQIWFPQMKSFDWGHFAAYFILALTYYWAFGRKYAGIKGRLMAVLLCFLFGITDEYHQSFVDGRMPDMMDLRNDTIGAALAMILVSLPPVQRAYMQLHRSKKY